TSTKAMSAPHQRPSIWAGVISKTLEPPSRAPECTCAVAAGLQALSWAILVRKFSFNEPQTSRSATRDTRDGQIVAQVRLHAATAFGAGTQAAYGLPAGPAARR